MPADPLERVTNLLALLLETKVPLTQDRIAHELEGQYPDEPDARRSAFERDKRLLREQGVPVETHPQHDGGIAYRVDRAAYELPDLGLSDDERGALQLAASTVLLGTGGAEEALWKLGTEGLPQGGPAGPVARMAAPDVLPQLFDATAARATVRFPYKGRTRTVDPWGLASREGWWYLVGRDHTHGEQRTYRVDRIEGRVTRGDAGAFTVPAGFRVADALPDDAKAWGEGPAVTVEVRVAPRRRWAVERELGPAAVRREDPDGWVVVALDVRNRSAFRSWVLAMLDDAEVLSPADLRAEVVAWLEAVAAGSGADVGTGAGSGADVGTGAGSGADVGTGAGSGADVGTGAG